MKKTSSLKDSRRYYNVFIEDDKLKSDKNIITDLNAIANVIGKDKVYVRGKRLYQEIVINRKGTVRTKIDLESVVSTQMNIDRKFGTAVIGIAVTTLIIKDIGHMTDIDHMTDLGHMTHLGHMPNHMLSSHQVVNIVGKTIRESLAGNIGTRLNAGFGTLTASVIRRNLTVIKLNLSVLYTLTLT